MQATLTPTFETINGSTTLELGADDLAIIIRPDGSVHTIVGKRDFAEIGAEATNISFDNNGYTKQARLFLSMVVTSCCEPLLRAALDLIGDKSVIDFKQLKGSDSVH